MKKTLLMLTLGMGSLFAQTAEWAVFRSPELVNDYVDMGDYFWLATNDGVSRLQKDDLGSEFWSIQNSGLPSEHIQSIAVNQAGTAWIGTYDGEIARFVNDEWAQITVPEEVVGDTPQDRLYCLEFDEQDHLWVGTFTGLHRFDGEEWTTWNQASTGEPIEDVWDIAFGPDGKVYFASFFVYELDGDEVTDLSQNEPLLSAYGDAHLETIGEEIWYCSPGLSFARYAGGEWTIYPFSEPGYWEGVPPLEVRSVTRDPEGEIVVNAYKGGLYRMVNGVWTPANTPQSEQAGLEMDHYFFDEEGNAWAFYRTQVSKQGTDGLTQGPIADITIRHNFVRNLAEGQDGSIYAQTAGKAIDRYLNGQWTAFWTPADTIPGFSLTYDMEVDAAGTLWLANHAGLFSWDGQFWEHMNSENSDFPFSQAYFLETGSNGQMWVCTNEEEVAWFDGQNWTAYNPGNSPLSGNLFKDMIVDQNDVLWVTTYQEELFRLENGQWQLFTNANSIIPDDYWSGDLALDEQNRLWVSLGYNGLLSIDGETWTIIPTDEIPGFDGYINSIGFSAGWFYLTGNGSLIIWDGAANWENYSEEDSPLDGYIYDMLFDSQDRLWLATYHGLLMLQQQTTDVREPFAHTENLARVFPNPALDLLAMEWVAPTSPGAVLQLRDASGRLLRTLELPAGSSSFQVEVSGLLPGLYLLHYIDGRKQEVVKWVKG